MSLEYYILCKTKYENIILNLKDIIENYDNLFLHTSKLDIDEVKDIMDFYQHNEYKEHFLSQLKNITQLKRECELKINILCNHEFVNDIIDISPERSQNITYCKICEYTIPN